MFVCKYCNTEIVEHQPNCPNCGAPIKVSENKIVDSKTPENKVTEGKENKGNPNSIREICTRYEDTSSLYFDDAIDAKRMATVRKEFNIPPNETVFLVYDDTLFGSNKAGFAICAGGLYWKNDWSVDTKRTFLSWEAFADRNILLEDIAITLERGDAIGVAGVGDDNARKQILKLLQEIKALL